MEKKLSEIFKKYVPADNYETRLLEDGEVVRISISDDKKSFVATTKFSHLFKKRLLYAAEENLRKYYEMNFIRISPKYDISLLNSDYFSEIFIECSTRKGMTRGMIPKYTVDIGEDEININVWQTEAGMQLIERADSADKISDVIYDEFDIRKKVVFTRVDDGTNGYEQYEYEMRHVRSAAALLLALAISFSMSASAVFAGDISAAADKKPRVQT